MAKKPAHERRKLGTEEVTEDAKPPRKVAAQVDPQAHLPALIPEVVGALAVPELPELVPWLDIPEGLSFDEWSAKAAEVKSVRERLGRGAETIGRVNDCLLFRVGDFLNYGDDHYQEAAQFMDGELFGYSDASVRQARWVCSAIPKADRKKELSYRHHMIVAGCKPAMRQRWLDRAVAEGLSSGEMKQAMNPKKAKKKDPDEIPAMEFTAERFDVMSDAIYAFYDVLTQQRDGYKHDSEYEPDLKALDKHARIAGEHIAALLVGLEALEEEEGAA